MIRGNKLWNGGLFWGNKNRMGACLGGRPGPKKPEKGSNNPKNGEFAAKKAEISLIMVAKRP